MGIFYSHAPKILCINNMTKISKQYIMKHWTKDVRKRIYDYKLQGSSQQVSNKDDAKNELFRNHMMQFAYNLVTKCQGHEETRKMCDDSFSRLEDTVDAWLAKFSFSINSSVGDNKVDDGNRECELEEVQVLNLASVQPEGVSSAKLKGHFERRNAKLSKQKKKVQV